MTDTLKEAVPTIRSNPFLLDDLIRPLLTRPDQPTTPLAGSLTKWWRSTGAGRRRCGYSFWGPSAHVRECYGSVVSAFCLSEPGRVVLHQLKSHDHVECMGGIVGDRRSVLLGVSPSCLVLCYRYLVDTDDRPQETK